MLDVCTYLQRTARDGSSMQKVSSVLQERKKHNPWPKLFFWLNVGLCLIEKQIKYTFTKTLIALLPVSDF